MLRALTRLGLGRAHPFLRQHVYQAHTHLRLPVHSWSRKSWLGVSLAAQAVLWTGVQLKSSTQQPLCDRQDVDKAADILGNQKKYFGRCASSCKGKPRSTLEPYPPSASGIPFPDDCGEDAYFICETNTQVYFGVADGVGGWQRQGVNPAEFAWALMTNAQRLVKEIPTDGKPVLPSDLLAAAHESVLQAKTVEAGSSTACIVSLDKTTGVVQCSNLGDSGLVLVREGRVIYHTKEQQHMFNAPYQLAVIPPRLQKQGSITDRADQADNIWFQAEEGDILVVATDGLFDNLFDEEIEKELKDQEGKVNVLHIADRLVSRAALLAEKGDRISPFSKNARQHGYKFIGGKDPIVIVIGNWGPDNQASPFPNGWHLDVLRGQTLLEKVPLEGRKVVLLGRNEDICQVILAHPSASRQHAVILYHPMANRAYIYDLGSSHGSFLSSNRLPPNQLTALASGSMLHFGASTRYYVLRDAPPEENDLIGRTAYNAMVAAQPVSPTRAQKRPASPEKSGEDVEPLAKRPKKKVTFSEEVIHHSPEPISPEGGRFSALVTTNIMVIPRPQRLPEVTKGTKPAPNKRRIQQLRAMPLGGLFSPAFVPKVSRPLAPTIELPSGQPDGKASPTDTTRLVMESSQSDKPVTIKSAKEPKKYAKEAWVAPSTIYSDEEVTR